MGDDKERPAQTAAPGEAPSADQVPRPAAGHVPEPPEKRWDAEPKDPFEGVDRRSPFEGRPPSVVPGAGEDLPLDPGEALGPGQPLPHGGSGDGQD